MPELRQEPLSGRWVIISTERAKRPHDFKPRPIASHADDCVFCAGNEEKTPPEIWAYRSPGTGRDQPGWWVRTIPNKFPALGIEGELNERADGLYKTLNGIGAHEVIVETPNHQVEFFHHPVQQIEEIIRMWRDRYLDLRQDKRLKYILVFKNEGPEAGASLEHAHSQLVALPLLPKAVEEEIAGLKRHLGATNRCLFCDIVYRESRAGTRIVAESDTMLAFCPYASRFPFETWIIPKRHEPDFGLIPENEVHDLGITLREVLVKFSMALGSAPYNLLLHSTPVNVDIGVSYHWHIEILPRLTKTAGFEFGTDIFINPTPPEVAAESLRGYH
ncbi:MAG: galactose-1-phosphate uridylyltransferase [Syntrophomonadaceae bacterium]|nr:galactose-1-phosphate uridylyltransferase [Syntrophomonadaceae bacterium]